MQRAIAIDDMHHTLPPQEQSASMAGMVKELLQRAAAVLLVRLFVTPSVCTTPPT